MVGDSGGPSVALRGETGDDCDGGQYDSIVMDSAQTGALTAPSFAMLGSNRMNQVVSVDVSSLITTLEMNRLKDLGLWTVNLELRQPRYSSTGNMDETLATP